MVHLSDYAFCDNNHARERLQNRTVDLHTPLSLGGFFVMFKPFTGVRRSQYYTIYWFKHNKGKFIRKALMVSANNR